MKNLYFFLSIFGHQTLDPDSLEKRVPDPDSVNPDPEHWSVTIHFVANFWHRPFPYFAKKPVEQYRVFYP
jgi:hypothetical protein